MNFSDGDVCFLPITCLRVPKPVIKCFRGGIIEGAMIYFFRKTVKSVTDNGREFHPYYPRPRYYEQPKVYVANIYILSTRLDAHLSIHLLRSINKYCVIKKRGMFSMNVKDLKFN